MLQKPEIMKLYYSEHTDIDNDNIDVAPIEVTRFRSRTGRPPDC